MRKSMENTLHGRKKREMQELTWHGNCTKQHNSVYILTFYIINHLFTKKKHLSTLFSCLFHTHTHTHIHTHTHTTSTQHAIAQTVPTTTYKFPQFLERVPQTKGVSRELRSWTTEKRQKGIRDQQFYCLKRNALNYCTTKKKRYKKNRGEKKKITFLQKFMSCTQRKLFVSF